MCHLSLVDVLLLIKKRPPPTLPKMVDVGSEEKVGAVSYGLSFEQTKSILYSACIFLLFFSRTTFLGMVTDVDRLCRLLEFQQKKQENKAPDKDAILKATANLTTRHTDRTVTQHNIRDVRFFAAGIKRTVN